MSWLKRSSSSRGSKGPMEKLPYQSLLAYGLVLLLGFALADLSISFLRSKMLPQEAPPRPPSSVAERGPRAMADYSSITRNNVFHFGKDIPPALAEEAQPDLNDEAEAVLSQLPLKLEGTIVHANPERSVATVKVRDSLTKAFRVGRDIEGLARLEKVERRRIIIRNLGNSRLEYVEIPEEGLVSFGVSQQTPAKTAPQQSDQVVQQISYNRFSVNRADVNKQLSDLGAVLNQARMVPNIVPGSGGQIDGFRFVSIQPGSIYEELGFKMGDVLKGVNGQNVNSPTQAMEMFQALKSSNSITLMIERVGRTEEFYYTINE